MPKPLLGSVGQGGLNNFKDVITVQYLLNCVPAKQGGPSMKLQVDGVAGPKTVAAIIAFQKVNVPWTDGRVDPNKKTLEALQGFDPNPSAPVQIPDKIRAAMEQEAEAAEAATGAVAPPPGVPGKPTKAQLWGGSDTKGPAATPSGKPSKSQLWGSDDNLRGPAGKKSKGGRP
jgi:peptidoglycan hydrolase-like protein with peptidoglycan-binding domain